MKKLLFICLILNIFNSGNLFAKDIKEEVRDFAFNLGNGIVEIAKNKKFSDDEKVKRITKKVENSVNSAWISRFVLGKYYRKFSKEQRAEFKKLYHDFMVNTYGPKLKNFNGRIFEVLSVEKQSIFYVARCEFLPVDSNQPISFDFRIRKNKKTGQIYVIDFVAEGVSLIESQRSEFDSAISKLGNEGFLKDLRKRVAEMAKN